MFSIIISTINRYTVKQQLEAKMIEFTDDISRETFNVALTQGGIFLQRQILLKSK